MLLRNKKKKKTKRNETVTDFYNAICKTSQAPLICHVFLDIFQRHKIKIVRVQKRDRSKKEKSFQISHFQYFARVFLMFKTRGVEACTFFLFKLRVFRG